VEVTDPLLNVTVIEQDALGRTVTLTDAARGITPSVLTNVPADKQWLGLVLMNNINIS
jgi:hypothetical protein